MEKKFKPGWLIGIGVAVVVIIVAVVMMMPKHLSGTYTAKTTVLFVTTKETLKFDGDKVYEEGTSNKGTYKIDGDKIDMTLGNTNATGTLSKDKQSFETTISGIDLTFHKDAK